MAKQEIAPQDEKQSVNRREFLNFAWLASLGFFTVSIGGVTFLFAMPRFEEGEFGGTFTYKVSELPDESEAPGHQPKAKIWLSNSADGLTALYKVCTHLGCLYNWRGLEDKFICPCHGSQFTKEGEYIQGPAPRSLDRFVTRLVNPDTGEVLAESADGGPLPVPEDPDTLIQVDTGQRIIGERHA